MAQVRARRIAAVVLAAGRSARFGGAGGQKNGGGAGRGELNSNGGGNGGISGQNGGGGLNSGGGELKQFAALGGMPVWAHSVRTFGKISEINEIVLVTSAEFSARAADEAARLGVRVDSFVTGGERRQDSVASALKALAAGEKRPDMVLVHDAARPLVSEALIRRVIAAVAAGNPAVVPAVAVNDTIKLREGGKVATQPRPSGGSLHLAQTPQAFDFGTLIKAHEANAAGGGADVTDDAALCEAVGVTPTLVAGELTNLKITEPADLEVAESFLAGGTARGEAPNFGGARSFDGSRSSAPTSPRTTYGTGYDAHKFEAPGPLRLGGVTIDFDKRLAGHSDGDVVLHAIADAVLGGAGLGDLGTHFPPTSKWAGDSAKIVRAAVEMGEKSGYAVRHVDVTVVAEVPRLAARRVEMERSVAALIGAAEAAVNVKITSTDGLGEIGRGHGIAAQAVVTLEQQGANDGK